VKKVARFAGGITLAGVALTLVACGGASSSDGMNQSYLVAANVVAVDCKVDPAAKLKELQVTADFVNAANTKQTSDILKRNEGATSLDPLKAALDSKIKECGGSPGTSPTQELAKQTCGEPSVQVCKTKGTEVFNSLPADRRGDENVSPSPANFNKELQGLEDKPEKLERAIWLVNVLNGFKKVAEGGTPADQAALAAQIHALFPNANQSDVNVGSQGDHRVDWALNAQEERGGASFAKRTLKTPAEVGAYLNEDTPESKTAKAYVVKAITDAGYGTDEVQRALTGEGYIPIQIKDASQVLGTTYFKDGKVLSAGKWRQAAGGDVYWLYIAKDGKLIQGALVRADCGNPDAKQILVVRPGMPPAPLIEQPPGEESCPPDTILNSGTGLCEIPPPPHNGCPPEHPYGHPGACKDSPDRMSTVGNGTGMNTGSGEYIPPNQMEQPPATSRTNAPAPTTTKATPPPVVTPTVVPTQPTVAPSTQPTNTGTLPGGPRCGNPELC
jgi:hypothetical protein